MRSSAEINAYAPKLGLVHPDYEDVFLREPLHLVFDSVKLNEMGLFGRKAMITAERAYPVDFVQGIKALKTMRGKENRVAASFTQI